MLTLLDALSLAGDRARQNDDAFGVTARRAFVLDGATDLHDAPLTDAASDAAWVARFAAARLAAGDALEARALIRRASAEARAAFEALLQARPWPAAWMLPIASLMTVEETAAGLAYVELGDCRLFALDAAGIAHAVGGPPRARDEEAAAAARFAAPNASGAHYRSPEALAMLRQARSAQNAGPGAVFGLFPDCADFARAGEIALARPAHALIATDGFAALVDQYAALDAHGLATAARERGLAALGQELRAIEAADAAGARHPRWKRSDDATALLLRLD